MPSLSSAGQPLPLEGVRVIDLATLIAGPTCARILGDFGADVVKVERRGSGDPVRAFEYRKGDVSLWWKVVARNKRPMSLDLKHDDGRRILLDLVDQADVLVENFRPGTLERLGLGPDLLLDRNPRLVVLRITGFGQTGPYKDKPGFGTLAEAFSGYADLTGYEDRPPLLPPIALADELTGWCGAYAVMVALYHRDVHGAPGQVIDSALYESLFGILGPLPSQWDQNGEMQRRQGSRLGFTAPRNAFRTSDGHYVALAGSAQTIAGRIFEAIERPELFKDPRFSTNLARLRNIEMLDSVIGEWIARHTRDEVIARFDACGAAVAPVHDMESLFDDPHYRARETIVEVDDDDLGPLRMQNVFPRLSSTPGRVRFAGRARSSATAEILRELGYDDEEIERLGREGAI